MSEDRTYHVQVKLLNYPAVFGTALTESEYKILLKEGMIGTLQVQAMLFHCHEATNMDTWYSFVHAKKGIHPFYLQASGV